MLGDRGSGTGDQVNQLVMPTVERHNFWNIEIGVPKRRMEISTFGGSDSGKGT